MQLIRTRTNPQGNKTIRIMGNEDVGLNREEKDTVELEGWELHGVDLLSSWRNREESKTQAIYLIAVQYGKGSI